MDIQSEKLLIQILAHVRIAALGTMRDEAPRWIMDRTGPFCRKGIGSHRDLADCADIEVAVSARRF